MDAPAKDHVNVFRYDRAIGPDPDDIVTAGHDTAGTGGFREDETVNAPALLAMFRAIIANNHAGGWRKIEGALRAPENLVAAQERPVPGRAGRSPTAGAEGGWLPWCDGC